MMCDLLRRPIDARRIAPGTGQGGFAAHANGRKRFAPADRTMGSQRDEVKFMAQK
jgi:hypothetical protein